MSKERKLIIRFMAVFMIAYLGFTLPYTLAIPYMIEVGYTPTERGLILAGMSLVGIFGQFIFGYLCDRFLTVKKFFFATIIALVVFSWLAYATTKNMLYYHLITIAFTGGLFQIVMGLLDAWTLETDAYLVLHYGKIRAFGALGWAIGSPMTAYIVSQYGYDKIGLANLVITIVTLLLSWNLKDAVKIKGKENIKWQDVGQLIKQKRYLLLVVILLLLNIILAADMYTVIDKMLSIGGTNADVSMKWSFQAVMELPLFFVGGWLLVKFGGKKLLLFAAVMYFIRFLGSAYATTPLMLIAVSGLQMFTFPLLNVSSKVLIADESPIHLRSSGLLFATSMSYSLATLISPILFGYMVEKFGANETLYGIAVACLIPFLLILWYITMKPQPKEILPLNN
ncbi:MAG: Transporter major facilitator family protein [Erysipelotrichaceae bacterium]|nr:MAG: major facilitator superfamily [Erysipelotrichaceae bacterium]TXT19133.1 MAG: Transporter major facilitator family protein [Erysipelotrichaceae bacterium]